MKIFWISLILVTGYATADEHQEQIDSFDAFHENNMVVHEEMLANCYAQTLGRVQKGYILENDKHVNFAISHCVTEFYEEISENKLNEIGV